MQHLTRRGFLGVSTGVAVGLGAPGVFSSIARAAAPADRPGGRESVLVVIELTGGNDGLNTIIPYGDPLYRDARPTLAQPADRVKKIDANLALHPSLGGFAELLEASKLAIVQGVGYPNPNRSHFESMDIWHKASRSSDERYGWLGRVASLSRTPRQAMSIGGGESPLALYSPAGHATSVRSLEDYRLKTGGGEQRRGLMENLSRQPGDGNELLSLVRQSADSAYRAARRLEDVANRSSDVTYPQTGLGARLALVAKLIQSGLPERIYYTSLAGFDTHAGQGPTHANLLEELGGAVAAFQKDMARQGQAERVLTMTFSEFGRRVRENGSLGTDHGVASQMFFIGAGVTPGLIGEHPRLDDLTDGDLQHHTDFRDVYATVLDKWLEVDSAAVLDRKYPHVEFLRDA